MRSNQPAYWRWTALDHFDGTTWTASDSNVTHGQVVRPGASLDSSSIEGVGLGIRTEDLVQNVVILQDPGDPWLPMAFRPMSVTVGRSSVRYDSGRAAVVPEVGVQKGLAYTVQSQLVLPTRQQLDRVTNFSEPALAPYEQLPANTPHQITQIAQRITAGQTTPFRRLLAIQDYLHRFTYDASVSGASDIGTVQNFLTHSRRGFCQQFATAMAVLARALGYPARVAVGFTPGRYDPTAHGWRVTTANAHAWVEVLFPGYGWLAFEPTPTRNNPVADSYLARLNIGSCQFHGQCGNRNKYDR